MLSPIWPRLTFPLRKVVSRGPVLWTRQFHQSPPTSKIRMEPRMAKSTINLDRRTKLPDRLTQSQLDGMGESLRREIPVQLLRDAATAGAIKSSSQAIEILTGCVELWLYAARDSPRKLEPLFKEIADVHTIAITGYLASRHRPTAKVGSWMLQLTANLGDMFSIAAVASDSLKLTKPGRTPTLDMLGEIAKLGIDPHMMVVHGTILQKRGQLEEASKLFEKAMEMSGPIRSNEFIDFTLSGRIVQPWAAYGALKGDMGDHEAARKSLEIGALEYENAEALKVLAQGVGMSKDWGKFVEYMTKLAMTGDAQACFQLGSFYLKQFYQETEKGASRGILTHLASLLRLKDPGPRSLAIEWFRLAAEYGHSRGALLAAGLLREDQNFKEGVLYLDTAEEDKSCSKSAQSMRDCFLNPDVSIDLRSELPTKTYNAAA